MGTILSVTEVFFEDEEDNKDGEENDAGND